MRASVALTRRGSFFPTGSSVHITTTENVADDKIDAQLNVKLKLKNTFTLINLSVLVAGKRKDSIESPIIKLISNRSLYIFT